MGVSKGHTNDAHVTMAECTVTMAIFVTTFLPFATDSEDELFESTTGISLPRFCVDDEALYAQGPLDHSLLHT